MKKLFALLLAVIMVLSMAACGAETPAEPQETLGKTYEELERVEAGNETVAVDETTKFKEELIIQ